MSVQMQDAVRPEANPGGKPGPATIERCLVDGQEFIRIELDGRTLLVPPTCPHRGSPMSEASIVGEFLVCKRHGATFDLRTGAWVRGPKCGDINLMVVTDDGVRTAASTATDA
jgi:nitrite reductase/ring-hydroxylating ferredoxin subunit